jgi:hypothetical protein
MVIANQPRVGSTIKNQTEDEDEQTIYGFFTCLNLAFYHAHPCIQTLVDWMMSLGSSDLCELLTTSLHTIGFLIGERAYGVPAELSPHICRSLFKEIAWATEDLPSQEEREAFQFTHYLLIKKGYIGDDGLEFPQFEDDLFFHQATLKVEFQTGGEGGDLAELEYHRFVIVVTAEAAQNVRRELNETFGVDEAQFEAENEL